jgi:branched-chain amino acid transport system permease protein
VIWLDLGLNAVATGIMLGCVYALIALGLAITFGVLHIPNVAHPAFVVAGAYWAVLANERGFDPILAALVGSPLFYLVGRLFYDVYRRVFESRGRGNILQSLTLFFGLALVIEISLLLAFGADLRSVDVDYVGQSLRLGFVSLPYRLLVPALLGPVAICLLWAYLRWTHMGLAIRAVAQGEIALGISGIDPDRVKRHAFGLALASATLAGAALVILGPIGPFSDQPLIGRVFAIVVLAGMGSVSGLLPAAILIGVAEALVASFLNPAWAPGIGFAILLATLALKPAGLFGWAR